MNPLTILLIDGSEVDRATYRRLLNANGQEGYHFVELDRAKAALAWCQTHTPDVILLDYQLPDLDGLEFLSALQAQTGKTEFPLILLTASDDPQVAVEAIKRGAQDYLDKTRCSAVELPHRVQGVVERWQLKQRLRWQQEYQRLVSATALRVQQALALPDILQITVEEIRSLLITDRVILYRFSSNWSGEVVVESVGAGWLPTLGEVIHDSCITNGWAEFYRQGSVTHHANIADANLSDCYVELMQRLQVQAALVIPILQNDQLWGLLIAHHCCSPRSWQETEIELLQALAIQLSIAIQQAATIEQLQQSQSRFQAMYEQSPLAIIRFNPDGSVISVNAAWQTLWGTSVDELQRYNALQDQQVEQLGYMPVVQRAFAGETVSLPEIFYDPGINHYSGQPRWMEPFLYPIKDADGQVLEVVVLHRDMTARKQAELALQRSEARLSLAQIASKSAVWDWDIVGSASFWTPEYYQLYGLDPTTPPCFDDWIQSIHPDDRDRVQTETLKPLSDGSSYVRVEYRVISNNQLRWFAGIGQIFRNSAGEATRMLGLTIDITQQKQVELQLQELNNALEQRVAERTAELSALNARLLIALQEQAKTQQFLQESEESRRLALDLTHIASWDWHLTSGKIVCNDNFFTLLGETPDHKISDEQITELWRSRVHPDDLVWVKQHCFDSIENHTDYMVEYRVIHSDGSLHWIMSRARAIYDEKGQPLRSLGIMLDITDRKQTEAKLHQAHHQLEERAVELEHINQSLQEVMEALEISQEELCCQNEELINARHSIEEQRQRYYDLFNFAPDGYIVTNAKGLIQEVNQAGASLLVSENFNPLNIPFNIYVSKADQQTFRNYLYEASQRDAKFHTQQFEITLMPRSGNSFPAAIAVTAIRGGQGHLEGFRWLIRDISDRKRVEAQQAELYRQLQIELQERKQAEAVLRESERRWQSLLDNVQLIVVGLNQFGCVNYINPFFLHLTGYTHAEVLGKQWFETFVPSSQGVTVQTAFLEVLAENVHPHYQNAIVTKTGEERFIAWNNTCLRDSQGAIIGTISIGEDITERQKIEQMKSEFLAIVSHELRTPLTSISGALELLATGLLPLDSDRAKQSIQIAATEADRLTRLVNDILDLERLESGKLQLHLQSCNLAELMQRSIEFMQLMADQKQITLLVTPLSISVNVDVDRILQVLTNLLSNAIKFSDNHSTVWLTAKVMSDLTTITPETTSSKPACSYVCLTMCDQGRGIPANKLETVFDRFQQIDASDSRRKGGTGLGLAICRNIVQQHGGRIWAESIPGQGSQFHFTLPLTSV